MGAAGGVVPPDETRKLLVQWSCHCFAILNGIPFVGSIVPGFISEPADGRGIHQVVETSCAGGG